MIRSIKPSRVRVRDYEGEDWTPPFMCPSSGADEEAVRRLQVIQPRLWPEVAVVSDEGITLNGRPVTMIGLKRVKSEDLLDHPELTVPLHRCRPGAHILGGLPDLSDLDGTTAGEDD